MCLGIEYTCGLLGQGLYSLSGLAYSALAPILAQSEVFGHGLGQVQKLQAQG